MSKQGYTYFWRGNFIHIQDMGDKGYCNVDDPVVCSFPITDWDDNKPVAFKTKFEELCGRPEFVSFDEDRACDTTEQIVEMMAANEVRFDQPCKFGCLVPDHSVYCHNEGWLYAPRKCRRTWHSGGKIRDEDCPGYKPNPRLAQNEKPASA